MSKKSHKSKKRKRKRISSSSSEEEKQKSSKHDAKKDRPRSERNHVRTEERERHATSTTEDVSHSCPRPIKKPVYRLRDTADQKPVQKEDEQKTKSATVSCSSRAKLHTSGREGSASEGKTVNKGLEKPSSANKAATEPPQRKHRTSRSSPDEKSSHRSSSKLRKQRTSPSSASTEQVKEAVKKTHSAGRDVSTRKTEEPSKPSEDCVDQRRKDFEEMCRRHEERKLKAKEQAHSTSASWSKVKNVPSSQGRFTPATFRPIKVPTTQQLNPSPASLLNFKIPKLVKAKPLRSTVNKDTPTSNDKRTEAVTESQKIKPTVSESKQEPVQKTPSSVTITTVTPPKIQEKRLHVANVTPVTPYKVQEKRPHVGNIHVTPPKIQEKRPHVANVTPVTPYMVQEKRPHVGNIHVTPPKIQEERLHVANVTPVIASSVQEKKVPVSIQPFAAITEPCYNQQVVEELHLARSEKRLEVNVMQSYGELTCMDIDPPEEAADSQSGEPQQQDLIIVLDTNILISHLDYVKKIRAHGLEGLGFPVILIPWVVLQELDWLKKGSGLSGSVAHQAVPAISYICNTLKNREPRLWGQSMQQAARNKNDLSAENNDDRVLQCCLQYQTLYPECALTLCTNDKNLCSKALLSGVHALSKTDLEAEVQKSRHGSSLRPNIRTPPLPRLSGPAPSANQDASFSVRPLSREPTEQLPQKDLQQQAEWDRSRLSQFEDCLRDVLTDILEGEMKVAFDDLWLEVVYIRPPWTLTDVLQCLKKHWIAVFGFIVPRRLQQNVLNLINFFKSGNTEDCDAAGAAVAEAKELVKAFEKSSSRVPGAIAVLEKLFKKTQAEEESPAADVVMRDEDEEGRPSLAQISHPEVWALFENIWDKVYQTSLDVFKALDFDPRTMQRASPAGGRPPQAILLCLQKLSCVVSQLLHSFSSVLSSAPGPEEALALLAVVHSIEIVEVDSRLTAELLRDCFLQQEYREKLRAGGNQLMELKGALDACVWTCSPQS